MVVWALFDSGNGCYTQAAMQCNAMQCNRNIPRWHRHRKQKRPFYQSEFG